MDPSFEVPWASLISSCAFLWFFVFSPGHRFVPSEQEQQELQALHARGLKNFERQPGQGGSTSPRYNTPGKHGRPVSSLATSAASHASSHAWDDEPELLQTYRQAHSSSRTPLHSRAPSPAAGLAASSASGSITSGRLSGSYSSERHGAAPPHEKMFGGLAGLGGHGGSGSGFTGSVSPSASCSPPNFVDSVSE